MKKFVLFLLIMFPRAILTSHNSSWTSYFGNPISAAWVTGMCAVKWVWPNKEARAQAPYLYNAGKACYALGAATSIISSAFAIQEIADAANIQVDHRYINKAGAAMTVGLMFMTAGEYMVFKADQKAHDVKIVFEARRSLLREQHGPSWNRDEENQKE